MTFVRFSIKQFFNKFKIYNEKRHLKLVLEIGAIILGSSLFRFQHFSVKLYFVDNFYDTGEIVYDRLTVIQHQCRWGVLKA